MPVLIGVAVIVLFSLLQIGIVSQLPLIQGRADLILLVLSAWALNERVEHAWEWTVIAGVIISLISATPFFLPLFVYLAVTALARLVRRRVWQTPLLMLLFIVLIGTLLQHGLNIISLSILGSRLPLKDSLALVTLPSLLLNLLLALPVYTMITDIAGWVYPVELET
jgi:cell shape-determining protein MreD